MRGVDGNYLNTQGDATARMQVAYQADVNRQQIRAQMETTDSLRKLREQVNETEKTGASGGPREIKDDEGSGFETYQRDESPKGKEPGEGRSEHLNASKDDSKKIHIDIRA